jgi:hypothetical protein
MTRDEIKSLLQSRHERGRWLSLLHDLLPTTKPWLEAQPRELTDSAVLSAEQIAHIPLADDRTVAVLEVRVAGQVDLQRNRVGLRNLVARFIDNQKADAVLAFFIGDSGDYRFSFVARTNTLTADGQLELNQTAPRRYTYLFGPGQACRTAVERFQQLRASGAGTTLKQLTTAFQVEPLFKEFYTDYGRVFDTVENYVRPTLPDKETLRLFTQRLFNRLMFLAFVERKGWLRLGNRTDYLRALWDHYTAARRTATGTPNFYRDHLTPLFFEGLNQPDRPRDQPDPRFGSVPYLNGGLFERAEDGSDLLASLCVPDEALAAILDSESGLFSRYNFTVAESTPLEIDVAVDPEMLGKVFEELVTGRHEHGSYYTPKPIVSFMGRAAIVEYLIDKCPKETRIAIEAFVYDRAPGGLKNAEAVLHALRHVTICDPACGSGAYLLGMLHELLELRTCLFNANQKLDAATSHARKLEIIERNLYGVDKDAFAVGIARLRLWLSLAVEYDEAAPPPLPNLDFKIECGNSLASPAPADVLGGDGELIGDTVREFRAKKAAYLNAHSADKIALRTDIEALKTTLKGWLSTDGPADAFHWAIEFAEVFMPTPAVATLTGEFNLGHELAPAAIAGGFDIVVANPPYVRMELIKPQKPQLRKRFPNVHAERADLYIYFYARAHQLLRPGGVAAFISSNKWLRAGYGELLRQHLLDAQAFRLVMDFGDLPVFQSATAYPCIFLWQKRERDEIPTEWAKVTDLDRCYADGVRQHFDALKLLVPADQFGEGRPRLATSASADLRGRMEQSGTKLKELFRGQPCRGVVTGFNEAFIITQETRDKLVGETPAAEEIIKPLLIGEDVRRYSLTYRGSYMIYAFHGIDIERYPSVKKHLNALRSFVNENGKRVGLEHRATEQEWFELQQPQMAYREWFDQPKILYPEIGLDARFAMDEKGLIINNKAFFLPSADWFLLGVLNSKPVWSWITQTLSPLRGGYWEFRAQYLEELPIPRASASDREDVGKLAKQAQTLHGQRRALCENFIRALGVDPADSGSRNPLEQPWSLAADDYAKRARKVTGRAPDMKLYEAARDETAALTEQIAKLEAEIDTRVAALYGLDAEDQRWAAKSAPADDKQSLFFGILAKLKDGPAYFPTAAIQVAANAAELSLTDGTLRVYLSEAVAKGHLQDAGRGWYSRLSERVTLDPKPVAKLVRLVEKSFPLLDFCVWSTVQLNPWMHHLLAQPVTFLHAPLETLQSVGEKLRNEGWEVAVNPPASTAAKLVRPGEKMVVLRPSLGRQPAPEGRQAVIEHILVDLIAENASLSLMDDSEAQAVVTAILDTHLVQIASLLRYAASRKNPITALDTINQRHPSASSDNS